MKPLFYIFIYLNIYTIFSSVAFGQTLELEIAPEIEISKDLRDSLQLKKQHTDYNSIVAEIDTLHLKLNRLGFIENKLDTLVKKNDSVYIANYTFGNRYKFLKIYFNKENFRKETLKKVSENITETNFIIRFTEIETALQFLNSEQIKDGTPFGKITLDKFQIENDATISAEIKRRDGRQRTIDNIVVKGYEKFPRSFLKYTAGIKKGKLFNKEKITSQSKRLNALAFSSNIKPPEVLFKNDSTTVYLYLKKKNANNFDGILGFATDEETQKLSFNGYLNLELNNNLNFGEQLSLNYKSDGNEQVNFSAKAKLPYLFKSPIGTSFELNIFKRDSTFINANQQARVNYQFSTGSEIYIGYKTDTSSNLLDNPDALVEVQDYESKFITAGIGYFIPNDSELFSRKLDIQLSSEIGSRKQGEISNDQQRYSITLEYILNINKQNSIFMGNQSSILFSDTYITNELYRIGGINSIRGFNENSIDASAYSLLTTEYRYKFTNSFYLHSIIDVGYFENEVISLKEKIYSFGFGIGLITNSGLLKLNFANGNSDNQDFKFSNSKIHLSLTTRF